MARERTHRCVVCYAESDDGVHFVKPELDLFAFNEVQRTNIVLVGSGGHSLRYANSVVVDPRDPDAFAAAITPQTRLLFGETLGNPGLEVLNIPAVSEVEVASLIDRPGARFSLHVDVVFLKGDLFVCPQWNPLCFAGHRGSKIVPITVFGLRKTR